MGDIEFEEQAFRAKSSGMRFRPFSESANIKARGYSIRLQRAVCDFGADHAFGQVNAKLQEHYGISIPTSSAQLLTEFHAACMQAEPMEECYLDLPSAETIIAQSDGSMIPIVSHDDIEGQDKRKHKQLHWKEARLTLAHAKGSMTPCFAGTIGSVQETGRQLSLCVIAAGSNESTYLHCVGDGAKWIASQVEEQFGDKGNYLIDFYHLCDYLSAAATTCAPTETKGWLETQKKAMKANRHEAVLQALAPHIEKDSEHEMPVLACYRYIQNRPDQLNYKQALDNDLPIGSGEIESAHRYVLQKRLKISGAWWKLENAKNMIKLRITRANNQWNQYWEKAA